MMETIAYRVSNLERKINESGLDLSTIREQLSELTGIVGDVVEILRINMPKNKN